MKKDRACGVVSSGCAAVESRVRARVCVWYVIGCLKSEGDDDGEDRMVTGGRFLNSVWCDPQFRLCHRFQYRYPQRLTQVRMNVGLFIHIISCIQFALVKSVELSTSGHSCCRVLCRQRAVMSVEFLMLKVLPGQDKYCKSESELTADFSDLRG